MQILCSSGFIGSYLSSSFSKQGHSIVLLRRSDFLLDPRLLAKKIENCEVIINLVGESLFSFWGVHKKKRILESRLFSTEKLVKAFGFLEKKPSVFLSASAVGYYGNREEVLTEQSKEGATFLAFVCKEWEAKAKEAEKLGIRTVFLRFGVVLGRGGFLQKSAFFAKLGLYPILGEGDQYMSWIDIEDLFRALGFIIKTPSLRGAVNLCSPFFLSQGECADILNGKKTSCRIPSFLFRGFLREFLFSSQKVFPEKLLREEFVFKFPHFTESFTKYKV